MTGQMVPTRLGRLHVQIEGSGRTTVLWHSLFVDSTTWSRLRPLLVSDRRLILIDGPGHGQSDSPPAGFPFAECAAAALDVLDSLAVDEPVDWVGNAWGGHVGLMLAARSPERVRSLVTVATPVHALTRSERRKIVPMVWAYRLVGAAPPLASGVARVLLGADFITSRPDDTALVLRSIRGAPRIGMHRAMNSVMLNRPDITSLLPGIDVPTLMVAPKRDPLLTVAQVQTAVAQMPDAAMVVLDTEGHVAPILTHADDLAAAMIDFWTRVGTGIGP